MNKKQIIKKFIELNGEMPDLEEVQKWIDRENDEEDEKFRLKKIRRKNPYKKSIKERIITEEEKSERSFELHRMRTNLEELQKYGIVKNEIIKLHRMISDMEELQKKLRKMTKKELK